MSIQFMQLNIVRKRLGSSLSGTNVDIEKRGKNFLAKKFTSVYKCGSCGSDRTERRKSKKVNG
jgi:hypothetical protein